MYIICIINYVLGLFCVVYLVQKSHLFSVHLQQTQRWALWIPFAPAVVARMWTMFASRWGPWDDGGISMARNFTSWIHDGCWLLRPRLVAALCVVGICRNSWWVFCKHSIAYIYPLLKTGDFWGSPWTEGLGLTRLVISKRSVYSRYLWNTLEYFSVELHLWTLLYNNDFLGQRKWMVDITHRHLRQHETSLHHAFLINEMWRFQIDWGTTKKWSLPLNQLANIAIIPWRNEVVARVMEELGQKADKVDVTGTTELRKVTHCHKGFGCSWMPLFMMMSHVIRDEYLRCLSG